MLVRDGAIRAVSPKDAIDATGAGRIELPNATLTPGLIDLHSHLPLHPYDGTASVSIGALQSPCSG